MFNKKAPVSGVTSLMDYEVTFVGEVRAAAFLEFANDPAIHAIWFARGGYGACRIAEDAVAAMTGVARAKAFLGYSDQGNLLGALNDQTARQGLEMLACIIHCALPGQPRTRSRDSRTPCRISISRASPSQNCRAWTLRW